MAHDVMMIRQPPSIAAASNAFFRSLPDGAQQSRDDDRTMVSKTSPTVWEYDMFRIEWTRRSILRDLYEMLREDTRLQRANHVFASTAVRRGFDIRITSEVSRKEAAKAQDVVNDFIRRVQFNAKLTQWARVLLRDGDLFLNPFVDPATRLVLQIKSLPAISMQRNDDITGNFPDLRQAFQQIDPISLQPLLELELWQVNHIRWSHEDGQRYGRSQYLGNLRTWRMLNMTEQDLVVRRRTRAAPKRLHNVGTADHPGTDPEIDAYMERNKLRGSQREIATDYFGNGLTSITDLNADAQLDHIADIQYLNNVHMVGTGVPLSILGFGEEVNRDILEDQMRQFKEDVEELRRLLEYGDGAAYSGFRNILDFQLALQAIDPSILDYNIIWYEADNDTANDRVNRITQLRSAVPDPLLSRKTAMRLLGRDIGLDTDDSLEQELEQIKAEQADAMQEEQVAKNALNPPGTPDPTPLTDAASTEFQGANEAYRNVNLRATGNDIFSPSRNDPHLLQLEQQIRTRIKNLFGTVAQRFVLQNRKNMAKLADVQPSIATGILDSYTVTIDPYTEMLLGGHSHSTDAPQTFQVNPAIYPLLADLMERYDLKAQLTELLKQVYQQTNHTVRAPVRSPTTWHANPILTGLAAAGIPHAPKDEHGNIPQVPREQPYKPSLQTSVPATGTLQFVPKPETVTPPQAPPTGPMEASREVAPSLEVQSARAQQMQDLTVAQRAADIVDTTQKMLAKALMEAMASGDPVDGWVRRALSVLDLPDWRADMIAQTEVSNAFNEALKRLYSDAGVDQVQWVTHMDDKTCPICASRNGATFALDSLPAIPSHPRCRCYTVPVRAQEGS